MPLQQPAAFTTSRTGSGLTRPNKLGICPRGSRIDGREVNVVIEYDGPRLDDSRGPGNHAVDQKLDERAPGYGFGLPITRELAELCGGAEFV